MIVSEDQFTPKFGHGGRTITSHEDAEDTPSDWDHVFCRKLIHCQSMSGFLEWLHYQLVQTRRGLRTDCPPCNLVPATLGSNTPSTPSGKLQLLVVAFFTGPFLIVSPWVCVSSSAMTISSTLPDCSASEAFAKSSVSWACMWWIRICM